MGVVADELPISSISLIDMSGKHVARACTDDAFGSD